MKIDVFGSCTQDSLDKLYDVSKIKENIYKGFIDKLFI